MIRKEGATVVLLCSHMDALGEKAVSTLFTTKVHVYTKASFVLLSDFERKNYIERE